MARKKNGNGKRRGPDPMTHALRRIQNLERENDRLARCLAMARSDASEAEDAADYLADVVASMADRIATQAEENNVLRARLRYEG